MPVSQHTVGSLPQREQSLIRELLAKEKVRLDTVVGIEQGWEDDSAKEGHDRLPGKQFDHMLVMGDNYMIDIVYSESHHKATFDWQ